MGFIEENNLCIVLMISATRTMFFYSNTGWHHLPANRQGKQSDTQGMKIICLKKKQKAAATQNSAATVQAKGTLRLKQPEWFATKWLVKKKQLQPNRSIILLVNLFSCHGNIQLDLEMSPISTEVRNILNN